MRKVIIALLCVFLAACNKPRNTEAPPTGPAESVRLVEDMTGVWSDAENDLVTIDFRDNALRLVIGDDPKEVKLGDVDTQNETVNLLLRRASDNKQIIWTLQRVWNDNKTTFRLRLTTEDGSSEELNFVRQISTDDINRLTALYQAPSHQDEPAAPTQ